MQMYPVPTNAKYQGATDRCIGEWLKGTQRDKILLATKVDYKNFSLLLSLDILD